MTLSRNHNNDVVVSVTEKTTITNPSYLFQFKRVQTNVSYYCIAQISERLDTRDAFNIKETGSVAPVPEQAEVQLPVGDYAYFIYQQSSTTNLNPVNLNMVESGKCLVSFDDATPGQYSKAPTTNTAYDK